METKQGAIAKAPSWLMDFMETMNAPQREAFAYAVIFAAIVLILFLTHFMRSFLDRHVSRWLSPIIHAKMRKRMKKAGEGLKRSLEDFRKEVSGYRDAVKSLVDCDYSSQAGLQHAADGLKDATGRLSLPKINPEKLKDEIQNLWIHDYQVSFYKVAYQSENLLGFCNTYKKYYARVSREYLEDIEALITSNYHMAGVKPDAEYIMQKHTQRDAERAHNYFKNYLEILEWAVEYAESLEPDLNVIIRQNNYVALFAAGD